MPSGNLLLHAVAMVMGNGSEASERERRDAPFGSCRVFYGIGVSVSMIRRHPNRGRGVAESLEMTACELRISCLLLLPLHIVQYNHGHPGTRLHR